MQVPQFVLDFFKRLRSKNPKFFNRLITVSVAIGSLSFLVSYLESNGIKVPYGEIIGDVSMKIGAATAIIMGNLAVDDQSKLKP